MDAFIVHGGLGSTVEAIRMRKPVAVTGILLFDQRFWGALCHQKGIGPPPVHIDDFKDTCVAFVDEALGPDSAWAAAARALDFGNEADDGVAANVEHFAKLIESATLRPAAAPPPKRARAPGPAAAPTPAPTPAQATSTVDVTVVMGK